MSPSPDKPSLEIDIPSRQLFVDTVKSLLPPAEWHTVQKKPSEIKWLETIARMLEIKEPFPVEQTCFMSKARYKVGHAILELVARDPYDSPSFVSVKKEYPVTDLEAIVDSFHVDTDLSDATFSSENRKIRIPNRFPKNGQEFNNMLLNQYEEFELRQLTGADLFTEDVFESILSDLLLCSDENRIE